MTPAFLRPMKVRKTPIPAAVAVRRCRGMARATAARTGVTETKRKSTPAQKMMPSATGHGTWRVSMIVKAKKALSPMPGATANGRRA